MTEPSEKQTSDAQDAMLAIQVGIQQYLDAIADEGEPELLEGAVVLFHSKGMRDSGLFFRSSFCIPMHSGMLPMLGLLDVSGEKAYDYLREAACSPDS